jgi:hypothetical protein
MRFFSEREHAIVAAAADRLIPPLDGHPGGAALGVAEYVDQLLGAFSFSPPRIFAGGPFSGRRGGDASFDQFIDLSRTQELAWRTRIEGSRGLPEREFNGPVRGWQEIYRAGIAELGSDFCEVSGAEQDQRLRRAREFRVVLYQHACEGAYGAPEYGGNHGLMGWQAIAFEGDSQPRGYTDDEVSGRD